MESGDGVLLAGLRAEELPLEPRHQGGAALLALALALPPAAAPQPSDGFHDGLAGDGLVAPVLEQVVQPARDGRDGLLGAPEPQRLCRHWRGARRDGPGVGLHDQLEVLELAPRHGEDGLVRQLDHRRPAVADALDQHRAPRQREAAVLLPRQAAAPPHPPALAGVARLGGDAVALAHLGLGVPLVRRAHRVEVLDERAVGEEPASRQHRLRPRLRLRLELLRLRLMLRLRLLHQT